MANLEQEARSMISSGACDDELVQRLHGLGASIAESIKIVRTVRKVTLGEAKLIVTSNSVWKELVEGSESLHEEALGALVETISHHPDTDQ